MKSLRTATYIVAGLGCAVLFFVCRTAGKEPTLKTEIVTVVPE